MGIAPAALITFFVTISEPSAKRNPTTAPRCCTISATERRTAVHPPAAATVASNAGAILEAPPTG